MFQRILIPTDFSRYSQNLLECIAELPGEKTVVLLHVIQRTAVERVWDPTAEVAEAKEKIEEQKRYLEALRIEVKTRVETIMEGSIAKTIQRVADEENATLIMVGARGRGTDKRPTPGERLPRCSALWANRSSDNAIQGFRGR